MDRLVGSVPGRPAVCAHAGHMPIGCAAWQHCTDCQWSRPGLLSVPHGQMLCVCWLCCRAALLGSCRLLCALYGRRCCTCIYARMHASCAALQHCMGSPSLLWPCWQEVQHIYMALCRMAVLPCSTVQDSHSLLWALCGRDAIHMHATCMPAGCLARCIDSPSLLCALNS